MIFAISLVFLLGAQLQIGDETIQVEIASTYASRAKGLMDRWELGENEGMLFIFDQPEILNFYMKNTNIPLAIGFFDENKTLISWDEMAVQKNSLYLKTYRSPQPALYALEVPSGWFKRHEIKPGMQFTLENASLDQDRSVK